MSSPTKTGKPEAPKESLARNVKTPDTKCRVALSRNETSPMVCRSRDNEGIARTKVSALGRKEEKLEKSKSCTLELEKVREATNASDIGNAKSDVSDKVFEKIAWRNTKGAGNTGKPCVIPEKDDPRDNWTAAVPRTWAPISTPVLSVRPLVLAVHLVPSLPIGLFEVLAEIMEVIANKPVVLLYESRTSRPVAKEVADIAVLPASENWEDGQLLPASFVFEHHLNKKRSCFVYADVVVAPDCARHVEDIMDLRGYKCAVSDRRSQVSAAGLLFDYLHTKGENPTFFGNTLDASSQLAVLQMVAGKQAEVGIVEAPVVKCNRYTLAGMESLHVLTSLGRLPPYRLVINKTQGKLVEPFTAHLLSVNRKEEWLERLSQYGVVGFAENTMEYYNVDDMKSIITSVPYY